MRSIDTVPRRKYIQMITGSAAVGLAGCLSGDEGEEPNGENGGDDSDSSDTETGPIEAEITYIDRLDPNHKVYAREFNEWASENLEGSIEVNGQFTDDRYEGLISKVRAGDHPVEAMGMDVVRLEEFHELEMFEDLEGMVNDMPHSDFFDGLDPYFFEASGDTIAVPEWIAPSHAYYNIEHFEDAGLEHPPETWDELAHAAEVLSDDTPAIGASFAGNLTAFFFFPYIWGNGGAVMNDDGTKAIIDEDPAVEALEFWVDMQQNGYTTDLIGSSWPDFHNQFINENVSIVFSNASAPTQVQNNNESLFENLGHFVFPRPEGGDHSSFLGGNAVAIMDKTEGDKLRAAKEFVKWINSDDGLKTTAEIGNLPARQRGFEIGKYSEEPWPNLLESAQEAMRTGQTFSHPEFGVILNACSSRVEEALSGNSTAREALEAAAQDINNRLE